MSSRLPLLVAPVRGFSAFVLAGLLEEHMPARVASLQRMAERGKIHPDLLAEVGDMWAAVREAGHQWSEHRAAVDGSTEVDVAEVPPSSSEIDTAGAAELLGVSPRRVRQLIDAGELNARRASRFWLLDRKEVELRRGVADGGHVRRNAGAFQRAGA